MRKLGKGSRKGVRATAVSLNFEPDQILVVAAVVRHDQVVAGDPAETAW